MGSGHDIRHAFWFVIPSGRRPLSPTVLFGVFASPREIQLNRSAQSGERRLPGALPEPELTARRWRFRSPSRPDGSGCAARSRVSTPCGSHGRADGSDTPCGGPTARIHTSLGQRPRSVPPRIPQGQRPVPCRRRPGHGKRRHPTWRQRRSASPKTGLPAGAFPSKQEAVAPVAQSARAAAF